MIMFQASITLDLSRAYSERKTTAVLTIQGPYVKQSLKEPGLKKVCILNRCPTEAATPKLAEHSGAAGSTAPSQVQGPQLDPELWLLYV